MTEITPLITFDQELHEIHADCMVYELASLVDTEIGRKARVLVIEAVQYINERTSKIFGDFNASTAYFRYEPWETPRVGCVGLLCFHIENWGNRTRTVVKVPVLNYRVLVPRPQVFICVA